MGGLILLTCTECGGDAWDYLEYAEDALCDKCENDESWEWDEDA